MVELVVNFVVELTDTLDELEDLVVEGLYVERVEDPYVELAEEVDVASVAVLIVDEELETRLLEVLEREVDVVEYLVVDESVTLGVDDVRVLELSVVVDL